MFGADRLAEGHAELALVMELESCLLHLAGEIQTRVFLPPNLVIENVVLIAAIKAPRARLDAVIEVERIENAARPKS